MRLIQTMLNETLDRTVFESLYVDQIGRFYFAQYLTPTNDPRTIYKIPITPVTATTWGSKLGLVSSKSVQQRLKTYNEQLTDFGWIKVLDHFVDAAGHLHRFYYQPTI
jgi:hypothetical protein